jgi:hypothetical protein
MVAGNKGSVVFSEQSLQMRAFRPSQQRSCYGCACSVCLTHESAARHFYVNVELLPDVVTCKAEGFKDFVSSD